MQSPKQITAREVMNEDLLQLHEETTIREAILTLREYNITGAPVINNAGECVGVFSSTDVLERDMEREERETPLASDYFSIDPLSEEDPEHCFCRDEYDLAVLGHDTVGQWMNTNVQAESPDTSLERVCQRMLTERIHRILVMEGRKLLGIISSLDAVRVLAGGDIGQRSRV